jgi:nucleoside-diphosphate kinase
MSSIFNMMPQGLPHAGGAVNGPAHHGQGQSPGKRGDFPSSHPHARSAAHTNSGAAGSPRAPETETPDMAIERTLSIIKPDATKRNLTGKIVAKFEEAGLRVVASKRIHLTPAQAGAFYAEHKERGFYGELCDFMASEPVVVQVLEGDNAIAKNREVMGATDPAAAAAGTIRKEFALSKGENSVHGSDSEASAAREIAFFFSGLELVG